MWCLIGHDYPSRTGDPLPDTPHWTPNPVPGWAPTVRERPQAAGWACPNCGSAHAPWVPTCPAPRTRANGVTGTTVTFKAEVEPSQASPTFEFEGDC